MKRLAAVEIDPARSNQHEFNAGRLRSELRLGGSRGGREHGRVEFLFYRTDDADPLSVPATYTLYDARRGNPSRTAEWRMYYADHLVADHGRTGDLMLLFRPDAASNDLVAIVARRGSRIERTLVRLLADVEPEELGDPRFVDSKRVDAETRRLLLRVHRPPEPEIDADMEARIKEHASGSHPLVHQAAADGDMPPTASMAGAAMGIVAKVGVTEERPDEFVDLALSAETELFMVIEEKLGNKQFAELAMKEKLDFHAMMKVCVSRQQSRRARRGRSLENHFRALLRRLAIPHGYQCETERGRKPDFIFPSCDAYHDPDYPDTNLRMVGCKTKVRERHAQWIGEARRIPLKYALCVDDGLSDPLIRRYEGKLRFFMPLRLLDAHYAHREVRPLLGSITDLVEELRAAGS